MTKRVFTDERTNFTWLKKQAFTLAEVLITLGIIGIVAAMTLPAVINKINMKHYIALLKEDYSILSQAHNSITADNGSFQYGIQHCNGTESTTLNRCFMNVFSKKLKSIRTCETPYNKNDSKNSCFTEFSKIKLLNGTTATSSYLNNTAATMILANGSVLLFFLDSADCEYNYNGVFNYKRCGWVTIDVNGLQKPNTFSKDIYVLYIMDKAIKPLIYDYLAEENKNGDCTPESYGYSCSGHYLIE